MVDRLPQNVREGMEYVICGPEMNTHTTSSFSANSFAALNVDGDWNFAKFREQFQFRITSLTEDQLDFDLVGVHPSIANGLRRIIIAEVPTMAIEHVFFIDNTGVVQDEVLAHRLGLVPIKADARLFEWKKEDEASSERNCIVFKLDVQCHKEQGEIIHNKVLSSDLQWLPGGSEMPEETKCRFTEQQDRIVRHEGHLSTIQPVHDDILLTKLETNQVVQLEAHCFKGIGKDHAKWSAVATAWYRLLPEVVLLREVQGKKARFLADQFKGLFVTEKKQGTETDIAKVLETRGNEIYLEEIRRLSGEPDWEKKIQLRKRKDYFLFSIESVGQYSPEEILAEALNVFIHKCDTLINAL